MLAWPSMVENVKLPARSNNGCWTCRLRRKKCDEIRPFCSPCMSLDLECHGYGPRPVWMDNGVLQKAQAARLKRLVSQGISKKGRRHQHSTSQLSLASPGGIATDTLSSTIDPSLVTVDPHISQNPRDMLHQLDARDTEFGSMFLASSMVSMGYPSPNSFVHELGSTLPEDIGDGRFLWLTDPLPPTSSISSDSVSQPLGTFASPDRISGLEHDRCIDLDWPASDETSIGTYLGLERFNDTPPSSQSQYPSQHLASIGSSRTPQVSISESPMLLSDGIWSHRDINERPRPAQNGMECDYVASPSKGSTSSDGDGDTEDSLFMHYLDQIFYIQYPFYHFQNRQGRGWVLAILRRTNSAYHAALALSERHLRPMPLDKENITNSLTQLRSRNGHYDLAIQKLQTMIFESHTFTGPAGVKHSLEVLMTLLQLFFFEIFNGGRENWHTHLRTASKFITLLLQERLSTKSPSPPGFTYPDEKTKKTPLCPEVDGALKFLVGSFIVFDIIGSASTRSAPLLPLNHVRVVDDLGILLEPLVGFPNSVMELLLEVVTLDRWKNEARSVSKLSIVDLAKRGDGIQARLQQKLAAAGKPSSLTQAPTHPIVSKIFLLATITYLHVVVSGPYPAVPEIANSVAETIAAFKSLQDLSLLRYLVWPMCISGCLALEEHYDFFQDLMSREGVTPWSTGTCFEAFGLMQECWKARVTSDTTCDWASVMKTRGCYVYLGN
ncbi:hypothetical protein BDW02DRAFT_546039 [Decorospora gaudefroyi]|uniref:Zn(2)-C6 fungal-type domain-containing protein n=1 Tax=Decorospora gaudefroyi TaxID=184978 RepID=A0A6A5KE71_9PLEO|nr:hypothetical protein BDW02DRAFT_546039 [Decorospora gaudefroyi]